MKLKMPVLPLNYAIPRNHMHQHNKKELGFRFLSHYPRYGKLTQLPGRLKVTSPELLPPPPVFKPGWLFLFAPRMEESHRYQGELEPTAVAYKMSRGHWVHTNLFNQKRFTARQLHRVTFRTHRRKAYIRFSRTSKNPCQCRTCTHQLTRGTYQCTTSNQYNNATLFKTPKVGPSLRNYQTWCARFSGVAVRLLKSKTGVRSFVWLQLASMSQRGIRCFGMSCVTPGSTLTEVKLPL